VVPPLWQSKAHVKGSSIVVDRRKRVLKAVRFRRLLPHVVLLLVLSSRLLLRVQLLGGKVLLQGGTMR